MVLWNEVQCGVDAGVRYVHALDFTAVNTHCITAVYKLIREDDEAAYDDSGYIGIQTCAKIKANEHLSKIEFRIVRRPKSLPKVSDNAID